MKKVFSSLKILSRRNLMGLGLFGLASTFFGNLFFKGNKNILIEEIEMREPSSLKKQVIDFQNLIYIDGHLPSETSGFARFVQWIGRVKFREKQSKGHNTRMFSDISEYAPSGKLDLKAWNLDEILERNLEEKEKNTKNFYIRTETPNQLDFELRTLNIETYEGEKFTVNIQDLKEREDIIGSIMMECAGNDDNSKFGLMSTARWSGIKLVDAFRGLESGESFFGGVNSSIGHTHVIFEGFDDTTNTSWNRFPGLVESTPGASWIFTIQELIKHNAFLGTRMNGKDLTSDHGYPLRLVVPCFYGCASIKWLTSIKFFTPTDQTPTEDQMREFSDRTNQNGIPNFYKNHKSPVIDLASTVVRYENWYDRSNQMPVIRLIGLTWGGIDNINPKLEVYITQSKTKKRGSNRPANSKSSLEEIIIHKAQIIDSRRDNTLTFSHWLYWWVPPTRGSFNVYVMPVDKKIKSRRLDKKYYQRTVKA